MDLNTFMTICSTNYATMLRLLPTSTHRGDIMNWQIGKTGQLQMVYVERHKYTDIIAISYQTVHSYSWLTNIELYAKFYHDAQLVEVCDTKNLQGKMQSFTSRSAKKAYPYWEKWQLNALLGEVLTSCLNHHAILTIIPYRS